MTNPSRLRRGYGIVVFAIALAVSLAPVTAYADPLASAKAAGYVGEKRNGMLGFVVSNAPADVKALVDSVNGKRENAYAAIAKKNGTSLASVAALAGEKAIAMTSPGNYVQNASGGWEKK